MNIPTTIQEIMQLPVIGDTAACHPPSPPAVGD
jgi:hypothetical protein